MSDLIGKLLINRYSVVEQIGRGGMAEVYKAVDLNLDREVAIKFLPFELLYDQKFTARFNREAKAIGRLDHPAIIPIYDFGEHDGQPYLVMKYVNAGTLRERMKSRTVSINEANKIIAEVAKALDYAHSRGVIHRDVKPSNILFDDQNQVFLSDFGIAKLQEGTKTLTGTSMVGTPAYMSPEQAKGVKDLDGRSDQYSLAIIAYQLLSGKVPYKAATPVSYALAHLNEPVPNIRKHNPKLSKVTARVLAKALAKDPKDRFDSCSLFAYVLMRSLGFNPEDSIPLPASDFDDETIDNVIANLPPTPLQTKPRLSLLWGIGGLMLFSIVAIALFSQGNNNLISSIFATQTYTITPSLTPTQTSTPTITLTPTATITPTITPTPLPEGYVLMPELVGLSYSEGLVQLENAGITNYKYSLKSTKESTPGTIIDQNYGAGELVEEDSLVTLEVAYEKIDFRSIDIGYTWGHSLSKTLSFDNASQKNEVYEISCPSTWFNPQPNNITTIKRTAEYRTILNIGSSVWLQIIQPGTVYITVIDTGVGWGVDCDILIATLNLGDEALLE